MLGFGNFSDRARKVLRIAKDYAQRANSPAMGTEHILLAIWEEGSGVAFNVLLNLGVDNEKMRQAFFLELGELELISPQPVDEKLPFSAGTKNVLHIALQEAHGLQHQVCGTEHFLLGLFNDPGTTAYSILGHLELDVNRVREEVRAIMGEKDADEEDLAIYKDVQRSEKKRPRKSKKPETPHLEQFGVDLTELARQGKIDPIIGRHKERERVMQILGRKTKNNPVLIGEPGTGKTKIVEGIALDIIAGNVPETLTNRRLFALDLAAMVAGTKYRGQFEDRIKKVMKEVEENDDIILFIDEIHTMVGAGGSEGGMDASNILKPALARGSLQCVGATTFDEYRKHIEKDGALERRFQSIVVEPSSTEETIGILRGLREVYQDYHKVEYTDESLIAAVDLSEKYINGRFLPDKAIDIIDEAGSRAKMSASFKPEHIRTKEGDLDELDKSQNQAVAAQQFEKAASIRDEKSQLREEIENLIAQWQSDNMENCSVIDSKVIAQIVSKMTDIPISQISEEESQRLLQIEEILHEHVISQHEAIVDVAEAIRRTRSGIKKSKKPMGSFLFVGPTGVGKTLLCKQLAKFLFGTEEALIHLDMSEYMEKHNASRLVGAPPGYVGYEEGGQLTEAVRRKPYSVVLFDEIEKAHPDVFNMLLQIMEEGRLTDSFGRSTSFRNTILIMTSNVGSDRLKSTGNLGFGQSTEETGYETMKKTLMEAVESTFKPEFLNRLDDIAVFKTLTKSDIGKIVHIELKELQESLQDQGLILEMCQDTLDFLVNKGYNEDYGARPLRRAIERFIENPLSKDILKGTFKGHSTIEVLVDEENDCLTFKANGGEAQSALEGTATQD